MTRDADLAVVYQATITSIGHQVSTFLEAGILILFGDDAPAELHDISVLHRARVTDDGPRPGDVIRIGEYECPVLAVGAVVRDNLLNLGHLNLKADGSDNPSLPGDVCVPADAVMTPTVGAQFTILRR